MRVEVDETGKHRSTPGVDDLVVRGDLDFSGGPDADDTVAFDQDGGMVHRRHFVAVEEHPTDESELGGGLEQKRCIHARILSEAGVRIAAS